MPPCEHSHLSSTKRILVCHKTKTKPWSGSLKRFTFQERNYEWILVVNLVQNGRPTSLKESTIFL